MSDSTTSETDEKENDISEIVETDTDDNSDVEAIPVIPLNHRIDRKYDRNFEIHRINHKWKKFKIAYEAEGFTWYLNPVNPYGSLEEMMLRATLYSWYSDVDNNLVTEEMKTIGLKSVQDGTYSPSLKEMKKFLGNRGKSIISEFDDFHLQHWLSWKTKNEKLFPPYRIITEITESTIPEYSGLTSTTEA